VAVTVAAITPSDGAVSVYDGAPVDVELTDSSDMDLSLVEVIVDGVSCTVANGLLEVWNNTQVSGGAIIDQLQDVWFGARCSWRAGELHEITVEVVYDSATISTTTFETYSAEDWSDRVDGLVMAFSASPEWLYARVVAQYNIVDLAVSLVTGTGMWYVADDLRASADGYYWVAHIFRVVAPASGVVGELARTLGPAAGVVEGWTRTRGPAAGIVQAWTRLRGPAAGIVAIPCRTVAPAAGIVGIPTTTAGPTAGIVYAVNARNTVEIRTVSAAEAALLSAAGITVT